MPPLGEKLAVTSWYGLFAPAGTPDAIINRMHQAVKKALATPEMLKRLETLGAEPVESDPASFKAQLPGELAHWKKVVQESGARID